MLLQHLFRMLFSVQENDKLIFSSTEYLLYMKTVESQIIQTPGKKRNA